MKLHLPHFLRRALLSCLTLYPLATLTLSPYLMASAVFEDESVTLSGSYPNGIEAEDSQLTNGASITVGGDIRLYSSSLDNLGSITMSDGCYISGGTVTNRGSIIASSGIGSTALTNSGSLDLHTLSAYKTINEASGSITAFRISGSGSLSNSGIIHAEVFTRGGRDGLHVTNNANGTIIVHATQDYDQSGYSDGACFAGRSLTNHGTVELLSEANKLSTGFDDTEIVNEVGGTLSVEIHRDGKGTSAYCFRGGSVINHGLLDISGTSDGELGGLDNNFLSEDCDLTNGSTGIVNMTLKSVSGRVYGAYTLSNSGIVNIIAESTLGHVTGVTTPTNYASTNTASGYLSVQVRGASAQGLEGQFGNSGILEVLAEGTSGTATGMGATRNNAGGKLTVTSCGLETTKGISYALTNHGTADITAESIDGNAQGVGYSLTNSGTVNITVEAFDGANKALTRGVGSGVTNSGVADISVTCVSGSATGINGSVDNSVSGRVAVQVLGKTKAYGVYAGTSSQSVTNSGVLDITAEAAESARGLSSSELINSGTIDITATSGGEAYGLQAYSGGFDNEAGASMDIMASGTKACGIYYYSNSTNDGTVSVRTKASFDDAFGIELRTGELTNRGFMEISAESERMHAFGYYSSLERNSVNNSTDGVMLIRARSVEAYSYGLYRLKLNNDSLLDITAVAGDTAYGIYDGSLINAANGVLRVMTSGGDYSYGIIHEYRGDATLTNSGLMEITTEATGNASMIASDSIGIKNMHTTNEVEGTMSVCARANGDWMRAYGFSEGSLTNRGLMDITAQATNSLACGIIECSSIINEAGATMTVGASGGSGSAEGIRVTDHNLTNRGSLKVEAQADGTAYGIVLCGGALVNEQGAILEALGSTAGVFVDSGELHNQGELKTNSITLTSAGSSTVRLYDGSSIGSMGEEAPLTIAGTGDTASGGRVVLGGSGATSTQEQGVIHVSSGLELSSLTLSLTDSVRLKMDGNLTIAENVDVVYGMHELVVDNEGQRKVTIGKSVDAEWDGAVGISEDSGRLTLSSEDNITMRNGKLSAQRITVKSASDTTMVLDNMHLETTGSSTLNSEMTLTNITVSGNTRFTAVSGVLTLKVDGVKFVLDGSNSSGMGLEPVAFFSADPLTETAVSPSVFYIGSDMLEGVNVAGNMTLDLSHWAAQIKAGGYDSIVLSFADDMLFTEETQVQATLNGVNFAVADYTEENMVQFSVANLPTGAVPEPTSATLSLLALTALAARRRRQ